MVVQVILGRYKLIDGDFYSKRRKLVSIQLFELF